MRNINELYLALSKVNIPVVYIKSSKIIQPPFIVYGTNKYETFASDNVNYIKFPNIWLEFYSLEVDFEKKEIIEQMLDDNKIIYQLEQETYLSDEQMFLVRWVFSLNSLI